MARTRPDFSLRVTWARLFRQVAMTAGPSGDRHGDASEAPDGPPPIKPFGQDDPSIAAWTIAMKPGDPGAAKKLTEVVAPHSEERSTPMMAPRDDLAIEVWTECELSIVHAAWRVVIESEESPAVRDLRGRLTSAIEWHLERTQPDNATTHPWGVHAVLELGSPFVEAVDYAASMIHAVEAAGHAATEPDPLSTWILLDAAAGLDRGSGAAFGA